MIWRELENEKRDNRGPLLVLQEDYCATNLTSVFEVLHAHALCPRYCKFWLIVLKNDGRVGLLGAEVVAATDSENVWTILLKVR